MSATILTKPSITRYLVIFLTIHLFAWTLAPILVRYNLPMDSLEGATWGNQLEWGYDKNPYLNAWLTALAVYLGGASGWMIYLFSQLSVITAFYTIWLLGKEILPKTHAFTAVILLEGLSYFNFHAIDFNDNTLELSLWALTTYFFYQAIKPKTNHPTLYRQRITHWLLTGCCAGLGMMAKYYTLALLAPMAAFLFIHPDSRKQLATLPPYLGLLIFILIQLPHYIWLFSHQFITIQYVFNRTNSESRLINHIYYPANFAYQQLAVFLPALLLYFSLLIKMPKKNQSAIARSYHVSSFNRSFLLVIGLGPFILTLLLSLITGIKLHPGWGAPLLSLWSLLLLTYFPPRISYQRLSLLFISVLVLIMLFIMAYATSLIHSTTKSSANFPGREIAQTINQLWYRKYQTPLRYIIGPRWLAGNVQFYSNDKPAVYIDGNPQIAPWINLNDLQQKGGVVIWDYQKQNTLPHHIKQNYPHLNQPYLLKFDWKRNVSQLPPIEIGVAFLPPKKNAHS